MIFLETPRLVFRSHQVCDEEAFVAMQTDPQVRRYVGGQAWPLEKALSRFREEYLGHPAKTFGLWATILKSEEKYIGCCGLRASKDGQAAHLAFYISRLHWGRGFASEAAGAFIGIAFEDLRLLRLFADVQKENAASIRILEKFEFKLVDQEIIPRSGRVICLYELLRTEWKEKRD